MRPPSAALRVRHRLPVAGVFLLALLAVAQEPLFLRSARAAADDGTWIARAPAGTPPSARSGIAAIYDPVRDRMLVFGGWDGSIPHDDVWELSLSGSMAWSALAIPGTLPLPRQKATAIYDPVRDRMVIFGGYFNSNFAYNDVWALSLRGSPTWNRLFPSGDGPPAGLGLFEHTAIYDPVGDRMVVFGGSGGGEGAGPRNEAYALSLSGSATWSHLAPAGMLPPPRRGHTAIYDPRGRMVVFGGTGVANSYNDVWTLSLSGDPAWSLLAPAGTPPPALFGATAVYDPVRDRMVVFGGYGGGLDRNQAWALSLSGSTGWSALAPMGSPPSERLLHAAIYDPQRGDMVTFGGWHGGALLNDVWALALGSPVSVPGEADALAHRFRLSPLRPNPAGGETAVDFEVGEPGRVVLDAFDTQGRRVRRIADAWFPVGQHTRTWRGDDDRGVAVGAGVYFVRMESEAFRATRRMVRIN